MTKNEMLKAIEAATRAAVNSARNSADVQRVSAVWAAIHNAVVRDCERRAAEQRELERLYGRRAA